MGKLALTNVYLESEQKQALAKRAKSRGTNISVEIRNAVDAYLAGITVDELRMLDAATARAKQDIDEIIAILDAGQRRAEAFFREIEEIKAGESE